MNTNTPISENTADALYDAATAQYALRTLELLRREYDLAAPREQVTSAPRNGDSENGKAPEHRHTSEHVPGL